MQRFYPITTLLMLFLVPFLGQAQESDSLYIPPKDTLNLNNPQNLNPVVLTGQYHAQSIDQSVFEVEVISRQQIEEMGGTSLSDVLTQTLNLNVIPNNTEGSSGVEQFGFGSDYVKILVDGVPVIGDEGFGNSIDVSQINLDDIEQIEIVEGSMGVQYGADAVTGVINIITKKNSRYAWQIRPYIQEETVGNEYRIGNRGKHIQSLKVGHNFSDNWYAEAIYTHTDFEGYEHQHHGKNYFNPQDANDGLRGFEWLPKKQNNLKGLINYKNNNHFKAFYKIELFGEKLWKYAENVHLNPNNATQTFNPTANDHIYRTQRFYNHLNFLGKIAQQVNYNVSLSYQTQKRNVEDFTYHLTNGEKNNLNRYDYNTREGLFSRGTLNNFFDSKIINLEVGYAINYDKGTASGLSSQDLSTDTQKNTLKTYSGFISAEINPFDRFSIRPGYRLLTSSKFEAQHALSLSAKYAFDHDYQLRAVIGTAPKIPTFEQLYFLMVDANHDIQGNADLKPEKGKSIFLHFKKSFYAKNHHLIYTPKLSTWYLDVKDKIDLIITNPSPLSYKYENINSFRNWGASFRNKFRYQKWQAALGASLQGTSKQYKADEVGNDDFLYSLQVKAQLGYIIPKWNTNISAFLKYNGAQYNYMTTLDELGNETVFKAKQNPYTWLNASLQKKFFNNQLEITLGARNIADVGAIKTTAASASNAGHDSPASLVNLGYGRSYFLKLLYHLNF